MRLSIYKLLKHKVISILLIAACCLFCCVACGEKPKLAGWDYTNTDVVFSENASASSKISVDIYVDATTSMEGYATSIHSVYSRFLNGIEAVTLTGFQNADIKSYKFGTKVKLINRHAFLKARDQKDGFYKDPDTYQNTHIDSVIDRTDALRLSVIITDLFQRDNDINALVQKIKNRCFAKGVYVGIAAIQSQFDGIVYDAHVAPYAYRSKEGDLQTYRPFYALFFGQPANIAQILKQLESKDFMRSDQALIISPFIIESYTVRKNIDLIHDFAQTKNPDKRPEELDKPIKIRHEGKEITIPLAIKYELASYAPEFVIPHLRTQVFRRSGAREPFGDSTDTRDITVENTKGAAGNITASLKCNFPEESNWYSYKGYFTVAQVGGLKLPEWVSKYSSENPTRTKDANKTLNLEKFVSDLLQASLSVRQPNVAKFYLTIRID